MLKFFGTSHGAHEDGEPFNLRPELPMRLFPRFWLGDFCSQSSMQCSFCATRQVPTIWQIVSVLTRLGEKLVVSPLLLCRGLGGDRILHQIGRFEDIARKIRQGWKFFEIRPNFAREIVDVQAQLVIDSNGTAQHFKYS